MNINNIVETFNLEKYPEQTQFIMLNIFLICDKLKVKQIGICKRDNSFKDSINYPFDPYASIFVDGQAKQDFFNEPKAWIIAEYIDKMLANKFKNLTFNGVCGNSGQHEINPKFVIPGIYKKINNRWINVAK